MNDETTRASHAAKPGDGRHVEPGGGSPGEHTAAKPSGKSWPPPKLNITGRLGLVKFIPDEQPHLSIIDPDVCRSRCPEKFCAHACPAQVYRWEDEEDLISVAFEGCLECGTCRSGGCPWDNIEMRYPRGGFGVQYRFG